MTGGALDGRVVLVTGGGAGIGRGIAEACQAAGAQVVVGTLEAGTSDGNAAARTSSTPTSTPTPSAPRQDPVRAIEQHALDVADPDAIARWVEAAADRHGGIDGLVANAGVTLTTPFLDMTLDELDRLWQINQRGVFLTTQAVARRMVKDGRGGSLVAIASNHARASDAGYEMYAATKAAIVAMCRAMAWSLGPHGIRVNSLSPGLTRTEVVAAEATRDPANEALFNGWHATGRYNTVREVGDCATFLLSDASAAMSGADLLADQGMAARLVAFS